MAKVQWENIYEGLDTDKIVLRSKKKNKKSKKIKLEADDYKRELVFKEDGQEYARVLRMLGDCRCEAVCFDGIIRLCHIRGKMYKRVWVSSGDIILVGLRDYQDYKADIILRYFSHEVRLLKAFGELKEENIGSAALDELFAVDSDSYVEFVHDSILMWL